MNATISTHFLTYNPAVTMVMSKIVITMMVEIATSAVTVKKIIA